MAYTRTITQLIADVRTRTSTGGAVARHPDSEITRFLVESLQSLRALLTDAGSQRFVTKLDLDTLNPSSDIPGAIGLQMVNAADTADYMVESIQSIRVLDSARWRELRRVSLPELLSYAAISSDGKPEVWADAGVPTLTQPSVMANAPAVRIVYLAPWVGTSADALTGKIFAVGVQGMPSVGASDAVCLEQYGFEWVIADAGLKVATRDNDAQETAQLLMAARADAEKRMLSTISRERSPVVQKRVASTIRRGRRTWET